MIENGIRIEVINFRSIKDTNVTQYNIEYVLYK